MIHSTIAVIKKLHCDNGISRKLLDELISSRGACGTLDFESLATELKKTFGKCWVRRWTST